MMAVALGTLGAISTARADDMAAASPGDSSMAYAPYYRAQEFSVDMFGSDSIHEYAINHFSGERVRKDGQAGGGVGLNYFFCRYVGVGADTLTEGREDPFIFSASGNLIVRIPILDTGIAPYAFGGGGYQFDFVRQDFGQAGAGVEFRITHHVGFFVDGRYIMADQTRNYGIGRAGLRISF